MCLMDSRVYEHVIERYEKYFVKHVEQRKFFKFVTIIGKRHNDLFFSSSTYRNYVINKNFSTRNVSTVEIENDNGLDDNRINGIYLLKTKKIYNREQKPAY